MDYRIRALPLLLAALLPVPVLAQSKPASVYVSVLDAKGEPAAGLTVADFSVREDNVAREVLKVSPATEPLSIALLVDDSQAASLGNLTQMIREGLKDFITTIGGHGEIAIVSFGERPTILVNYSRTQKQLLDAADRIFPRTGSGSYLLDAIVDVSKGLQKRAAARRVIAVLMIEDVEFSNRYYEQVLDELDKSRAALHVIAIGQPTGSQTDEVRNRNQVIAVGTERTGGRRDQVLAYTAVPPKMKQLANELIHQYVVTYARPDRLIPPEKVDITVTKPGFTVRAPRRTSLTASR